MKNLLPFLALIVSTVSASAQKVYFIYLQSDNSSAFYVKMNDKIYSSSVSGYVILPNLVDSTYNFSLGFPSSQSESKFTLKLGAKDRGLLIKNLDTGLGLFDLQDLTIIKEQKDDSPRSHSYIRRNDDFSSLLAKAAKDTSLLYAVVRVKEENIVNEKTQPKPIEAIAKEETKKEETSVLVDTVAATQPLADLALEEQKRDTSATFQPVSETTPPADLTVITAAKEEIKSDTTSVVESSEPIITAVIEMPHTSDSLAKKDIQVAVGDTVEEVVFKKSQVKKYSESSTSEGFGLVYYDTYEGGGDTIRLLIPNPPIVFKQAEQDSSFVQKDFIHVEELKKDTIQQLPIVVAVKNASQQKTQCKAIASNNDFFKLRKNMASETTDDGMVAEAKKFFKSKCFSTEQIKNLSALFLTSAGKYQFFDAAYLHVTDQEKFSSLETEIKDDYYFKRFKALIGD